MLRCVNSHTIAKSNSRKVIHAARGLYYVETRWNGIHGDLGGNHISHFSFKTAGEQRRKQRDGTDTMCHELDRFLKG